MRAVIFPSDPIKAYLEKGEVVERYFNPCEIFDDIDIVSLSDSDSDARSAGKLCGRANVRIHPVGRASVAGAILPGAYLKKALKAVDVARADVVIAHNSNLVGYVASLLAKRIGSPLIVHMHSNPDKDIRAHLKWQDLSKNAFWAYSGAVLEKRCLTRAAKVICAYRFIEDYAISKGVEKSRIEVVYHRIDNDRFRRTRPICVSGSGAFKILCVGRIFERKNPENIIRAIEGLNAELTLIGSGSYLDRMVDLAESLGLGPKVRFLKSVPNQDIHKYYHEADVFACVNDYGGVSKPVMEAMASSLPLVMKSPLWEKEPELVSGIAVVTDGSEEGFREAFRSLTNEPEKMESLGRLGLNRLSAITGASMEKKEADIILSVIRENRA